MAGPVEGHVLEPGPQVARVEPRKVRVDHAPVLEALHQGVRLSRRGCRHVERHGVTQIRATVAVRVSYESERDAVTRGAGVVPALCGQCRGNECKNDDGESGDEREVRRAGFRGHVPWTTWRRWE